MKYPVNMPQLSDTMDEGVLVEWFKKAGDKVLRGDIVASVETDKAIMDVEVFKEGFLSGPCISAGSAVPVGEPMAFIVESENDVIQCDNINGESVQETILDVEEEDIEEVELGKGDQPVIKIISSSSSKPVDKFSPAKRPSGKSVTPYARKLAAEMNIDLNKLKGDLITSKDIHNFDSKKIRVSDDKDIQDNKEGHIRSMTVMERAVCRSMVEALSMPLFHVSIDIKADLLKETSKATGVSFTVALSRASALAIEEHPQMNRAYMADEKIIERRDVDIGIAVASFDDGLVVPVLRKCNTHDVEMLENVWHDLGARAKERRLKPEEYANPTFMISNMGMFGVTSFDAIPTVGMAAAMAVAAHRKGGMSVTISADHRVLNGAVVAAFLNTFKELVEHPGKWMG